MAGSRPPRHEQSVQIGTVLSAHFFWVALKALADERLDHIIHTPHRCGRNRRKKGGLSRWPLKEHSLTLGNRADCCYETGGACVPVVMLRGRRDPGQADSDHGAVDYGETARYRSIPTRNRPNRCCGYRMITKEADLSDDDQPANVALLETILSGSAFTNVRTRPIPVAMLSPDTASAQIERLRAA